jgi:sulfoxide reductase heme-binding subunit YedZ
MALTASQRLVKPAVAMAMLGPWLWLGYLIFLETVQSGTGLGGDPVEGLLHYLGEWSLIALLCAFSVTPLQRQLGWAILIPSRRMVGLFAFAFALFHAIVYAGVLCRAGWPLAAARSRRATLHYAWHRAVCWYWTLLAITSTRGWQRRLGRRWKALHRWVYLAVPLALAHLLWLRKDGYADVALYTLWAGLMAGERVYAWRSRLRKTPT